MKVKNIVVLLILTSLIQAQTLYEVPIGSTNNLFEFELENMSGTQLSDLIVVAEEVPEWINLKNDAESVASIDESGFVKFNFDVNKDTDVGAKGEVKFVVVYNNQSVAEKTIELEVGLPREYALNQNYPNPFNPATTIEFQLPVAEKVSLKIYNMLGQEVASLLNKKLEAGVHKVSYDASQLASGRYIYKLVSENKVLTKKMVLMK